MDIGDIQPVQLCQKQRIDVGRIGDRRVLIGGQGAPEREFDFPAARRLFRGAWIANNNYDAERAARTIAAGNADLVSFGRPFIANPDLPERVRRGAPLNVIDNATAYAGHAEVGYTDYPTLEMQPAE